MSALLLASAEITATRYLLAMVCATSAVVSLHMGHHAGPVFRPHLALIAGWSVLFGLGMLALATGWTIPIVLGMLNAAAAMTIGGWTALVFRLVKGGPQ